MLHHFFNRCRVYFELDHRQAKTYAWLLLFTLVVICSPAFTGYLYPSRNEELTLVLDTLPPLDYSLQTMEKEDVKPVLFKKRIDRMQEQDWIQAGLPVFLAKRIVKYQEKVKKLTRVSELYTIYGMDSTKVDRLKLYLEDAPLTEKTEKKYKKEIKEAFPKKQQSGFSIVDINTVDSLMLEAMPAIGPVLTKRILKYRSLLKGYVCKEQYSEIYGISPEALEVLNKRTIIKEIPIVCRLSVADYSKLNAHFYLSSKDAKFILSQLKMKKGMCWEELKDGLELKGQEHVDFLELYYPCE